MSEMILRAHNLRKVYEQASGRLPVLKNVDFEVGRGEFVCVVGPSGAGKSTLLHIVGGLDKPSEGTVSLGDDDVYALSDSKRAELRNRKIGFVFQSYHLLPEFTALENVFLPIMVGNKGKTVKALEQLAYDLLEKVGLSQRAAHKPNQLSGGEQQRVAIARALINQPDVLLCDEPTGNLDSATGSEIIEILLQLNKQNRQTLVIVTHDNNIARRAQRIVYMKDGRIVESL